MNGLRRDWERLALVWAVALGLASSRWGAYLGAPPVFLTDTLLALGIAHATLGRVRLGPRELQGVSKRAHPGVLVGLFLAWAVLRFATSPGYTILALRDAAPYLYAVVAFVAASAYGRSNSTNRERTARLIVAALLIHLGWCLLAVFAPSLTERLPLVWRGPITFLSLRGDVDSAFIGFLIAIGLARVLRGHHTGRWVLVLLIAAPTLARLNSRAGLLASIAACAVVIVGALSSRHLPGQRRAAIVALTPLIAAAVVVALPATNPGQRLLGTVVSEPQSAAQVNAAGTTRARRITWTRVIDYTEQTNSRQVVGVGFGPDFLSASGGEAVISGGREGVRSPHNWFLNTYARLGLVGLLLAVALTLTVLRAAWRVRREIMGDDLLLVTSVVSVGMLVIGALGVVLESPFGAVPFFWAAGILLARPTTCLAPPPPSEQPAEDQHDEPPRLAGAQTR